MNRLILFLLLISTYYTQAQSKDRIAVIDTEFILKKMPEYQTAQTELKKRANEWDVVIDRKKKEIKDLKDQLAVERPLLTSQLIDERQEDIAILEKELLDYQQEKYGPNGDYFIQKTNLIKPIQDQIYTVVNELAAKKKYGVVLDKNDKKNSMLYANENFDISDLVIRELEKSNSKTKLSKKEIAALEEKEKQDAAQERQRSRREQMEEKQKENQRQKEDDLIKDYNEKNPNFGNSSEDAQLSKIKEQQEANKRKQDLIKQQQEAKLAAQKAKIEAQRKAIEQAKEKALADAEKKKADAIVKQQQLKEKQQQQLLAQKQKQDELKRQLLLKKIEADQKQKEKLAERQKLIDQRKKDLEAAKQAKIEQQKKQKEVDFKQINNK